MLYHHALIAGRVLITFLSEELATNVEIYLTVRNAGQLIPNFAVYVMQDILLTKTVNALNVHQNVLHV